MKKHHEKPRSAADFLTLLAQSREELGGGGRRVAQFFAQHLEASAMLSAAEIAQRCSVNASTVVRLTQALGFAGYRDFQALLQSYLTQTPPNARSNLAQIGSKPLKIALFAESGRSFNEALSRAAAQYCGLNPAVEILCETHVSYEIEPERFAATLLAGAGSADGVILVARDHPAINDAVRALQGRGVPVICLTTDLPSSGRAAYVGPDQYAAGATAAWLLGRMLPAGASGRVLFVYSVPFRCHQDREQGFRHVLRSEFPALTIDEKLSSNESIEVIYEAVRRSIERHGPPVAIYNVSGANLGVGQALEDEGLRPQTLFIGHELNENARSLLERNVMDITIGHDFDREVAHAVDCVAAAQQGVQTPNRITQAQVFTRFNCAVV